MKENKIKELQEELETLHVTQDARLACNADDLDIREEIAEVEEEIKELQDDTNADKENNIKNERSSIEEDIKIVEEMIENTNIENIDMNDCCGGEHIDAIEHILSDYKRVLKENEELKKYKEYYSSARQLVDNNYIHKRKIKDIIDRIDYDIKKTKEIISNDLNIYTSNRRNDYQILRLRAMNTKSLDIKKRLQKLLESEK